MVENTVKEPAVFLSPLYFCSVNSFVFGQVDLAVPVAET